MIPLGYFKHHFKSSPPILVSNCSYCNSVIHDWIINELGGSQGANWGEAFRETGRLGDWDKPYPEVFTSPRKVMEFPQQIGNHKTQFMLSASEKRGCVIMNKTVLPTRLLGIELTRCHPQTPQT